MGKRLANARCADRSSGAIAKYAQSGSEDGEAQEQPDAIARAHVGRTPRAEHLVSPARVRPRFAQPVGARSDAGGKRPDDAADLQARLHREVLRRPAEATKTRTPLATTVKSAHPGGPPLRPRPVVLLGDRDLWRAHEPPFATWPNAMHHAPHARRCTDARAQTSSTPTFGTSTLTFFVAAKASSPSSSSAPPRIRHLVWAEVFGTLASGAKTSFSHSQRYGHLVAHVHQPEASGAAAAALSATDAATASATTDLNCHDEAMGAARVAGFRCSPGRVAQQLKDRPSVCARER